MKSFIVLLLACLLVSLCQAQNLVGRWQLVKQTTCIEDENPLNDDTGVEEVLSDMKSMSGPTSNVVEFKDNNTCEESNRIISRKKTYNSKSVLYKFTGTELYFLDKKSRTIIEGYTVEKLAADSLIISNTSRVCETKIFIRIN